MPVVAIAGNHDSAVRVGFAASLLRARGLHLVGELAQAPAPIVLRDEHGRVHVHPIPYADAAEARHAYEDDDIHDQQAVAAAGVARALGATPAGERSVAVAHAFVAGALESESGRPLSVGGATQVPAAVYDGFDYVALGHLHRPQRCGRDTVRYAGSLLKYSFAEHDHVKSVSVVEIGAPGSAAGDAGAAGRARVGVETVALTPRRDVRRLEGTLAELLAERRLRFPPRRLRARGSARPGAATRRLRGDTLSIERRCTTRSALRRAPAAPGSVGDLELLTPSSTPRHPDEARGLALIDGGAPPPEAQ